VDGSTLKALLQLNSPHYRGPDMPRILHFHLVDHVHLQPVCFPSTEPSNWTRKLSPFNHTDLHTLLCKVRCAQRWQSTVAVEPPPAGGHLTAVASSQLLRATRETALRTPGLTWSDEHDSGPVRNIVGGRETRKMNLYQAVRDALRYVREDQLLWSSADESLAPHLRKMTLL
jgi:hypothetical protein